MNKWGLFFGIATATNINRANVFVYQNQAGNLDANIEDASEHFVYVPKKCTVNAQDVAFFLSTRLVTAAGTAADDDDSNSNAGGNNNGVTMMARGGEGGAGDADDVTTRGHSFGGEEAATRLRRYEAQVADLASEFEDGMVRF